MDEADIAQARLEMEDEIRKKYAVHHAEIPKGDGYCLECGGEIEGDGRWCDAYCRDSFEKRKARLK